MAQALIIIDVQMGMFAIPGSKPHDGEAVVERIASLIDRARASNVPIFFVQHDGGTGDVLERGKPEFEVHSRLAVRSDDEVVVKHKSSAFDGTDLHKRLTARGIDCLVICGMQTEYCVDSTFRGAREKGYRLILVEDGHSTFDSPVLPAAQIVAHHNQTLRDGSEVRKADAITFAKPA